VILVVKGLCFLSSHRKENTFDFKKNGFLFLFENPENNSDDLLLILHIVFIF